MTRLPLHRPPLTSVLASDSLVSSKPARIRSRTACQEVDWLILLTTGHGRGDDGGHAGLFIVNVAVTSLEHLDMTVVPAWGLDDMVRR